MEFFMKKPNSEFNSLDISSTLNLDITTVQKALKKLYEKKVLRRHQKNLENGGYVYYYGILSKREVKRTIQKIIDNWAGKAKKEIENWKV